MINVEVRGGLGNQMFQYAAGRALQLRGYEVTYKLIDLIQSGDDSRHHRDKAQYGLDRFRTHITFGERVQGPEIHDRDMRFNENAALPPKNANLTGYWQNEDYFKWYKKELREDFTPKADIPMSVLNLRRLIAETPNSTFLHVRRGDYVWIPENEAYHGTMKLPYYEAALQVIRSKHGEPTVFVFSDDPNWCEQNFKFPRTIIHTGNRIWDLYLMTAAQHAVIANSSYSWWGAWLGEAMDRMIIGPKQWFTTPTLDGSQIVPKDWIRL